MQEKIENALNESRILALVAEVMLGFEYQAVFQPGFHRLSTSAQDLRLGSLILMLLALALFISPTAYHQIVETGSLSEQFNQFISKTTTLGLFPFAIALGIDFYTICVGIVPPAAAIPAGVLMVLIPLWFWYGIEAIVIHQESGREEELPVMESEPTDLKDRIKFILTEARVVLPGVQALLGFQFAAVLTDSFERLPAWLKYIHLASLLCVVLCTVLLMTPAAFHRIVERGRNTRRMETFSRRMVLASMVFLAPGIAGDVLVVTERVIHSPFHAYTAGGLTLLVFYGYWFGYMFYRKAQRPKPTALLNRSSSSLTDE